jgi:uncharacterized phage protein (TIGR01671 family)
MREIKFRAWNMVYNKMTYVELRSYNRDFVEDDVIMQYTGLEDKNGKEIYEGDIARYYGKKFYENYGYNPLIKIIWQKKTAKFVWEGRDRLFGFNPGTTRLMEVVGNIYEHKHLLEVAE